MDIEQRLYGGGGRFTRVNMLRTSIVALLLTVLFYLPLITFPRLKFSQMFLERGFFVCLGKCGVVGQVAEADPAA
jgi:hypothetical protein